MNDIVYLHGWREDPHHNPVAKAMLAAMPNARFHLPGYHPPGNWQATRVGQVLTGLKALLDGPGISQQVYLIGYSFGGLLAALLCIRDKTRSQRCCCSLLQLTMLPATTQAIRLLGVCRASTLKKLKTYASRPKISCPTSVIHGRLDDDRGGSSPERIRAMGKRAII